jgi:hypothetical protein
MGSVQRQELIDLARNREVAEMIRKLPQIEDAQIVGHRSRRAGFSGETRMTVTLSVTPREGARLSNELYRSLQRIVGGAMSMADSDVTILNTRTGETIRHPDQDRFLASKAAEHNSDAPALELPPRNTALETNPARPDAAIQNPEASRNAPARTSTEPNARPSGKKPFARLKAWRWDAIDVPDLAVPFGGALLSAFLLWRLSRRKHRKCARTNDATDADLTLLSISSEGETLAASSITSTTAVPKVEVAPAEQMAEPADDPKLPACETARGVTDSLPSHVGDLFSPVSAPVPFDFLHHAPAEYVLSFVTEEHPQTIALILSHLPAPLASRVLRGLPTTKQLDVVRRVATLEPARDEVVDDVARSLKSRIAAASAGKPAEGRMILSTGAGMHLASPPGQNQSGLIQQSRGGRRDRSASGDEGDFAERLRRLMFVFDDLLKLTDSALAAVYSRLDASTWALALKGASEELRSKIIDHIPPASADRLYLELQELGPVRVRDVAAAQQQIVEMVRWMEDAGEIIGADDEADALRIIA